jgi:hypothetical protein
LREGTLLLLAGATYMILAAAVIRITLYPYS